MNSRMKSLKVQAQRKFAQGAFIPPNSNAVAPVKSDPPTPVKEERRSIIHNNLSAKSLLDIVSFQRTHTHSDPVVVLERLTPTKENSAPISNRQEPPKQVAQPKIHQKTSPKNTVKARKTAHKITKISSVLSKRVKLRRRLKLKNTMLLRSRENISRTISRKRTIDRSSTSDLEDDKPLIKLKRVEPQASPAPTEIKKTPTKHSPEIKKTPTKHSPEIKKTPTKHSPEIKKIPTKHSSGTKLKFKHVGRITRSARNQDKRTGEKKKKSIVATSTSKETSTNGTVNKKVEATEQPKVAKEPTVPKAPESPTKTFKQPAIPARFTRPQTDKSVAVASGSKQLTTNEMENNDKTKRVTGTRQQYYGDSGIKKWLNNNKGGKGGECEKNKTKAPAKPVKEPAVPPASEVPETESRALSPCPSESLVTFSDVMSAPRALMNKCCKECLPCRRVNMAEQISNLVPRSRAPKDKTNDNVYDFDPNEDENSSNPKPFVFNRKRKSVPQAAEKEKGAAAPGSSDDEEPVYLDLQKDSPHIIEITREKVPNSNKKMMKARLIQKSEAHTAEEFSLVEHEILLDQLLQVLQLNVRSTGQESEAAEPEIDETPTTSSVERQDTEKRARTRANNASQEPSTSQSEKQTEKPAKMLDAPIFCPTDAEFNDPIGYFEKIALQASKFGLCKVKAPPSFKPECILNDALKFNVTNHYISRLFSRWGPAAREVSAMRAYLGTQNIYFNRVPLLDSLEVNLPKLYSVVQRNGGLNQVMGKRLWGRVAEEMRFSKGPNTEKNLDNYYVKYMLPYDIASDQERAEILSEVERSWSIKHKKLVKWSSNPLHHAKKVLGESDSSDEELVDDSPTGKALLEAEDCVVAGRPMQLSGFKKVAAHAMTMHMGKSDATAEEIEKEYWRLVLLGTEHVCVNAASIDTAASGYGFSKNRNHPEWKHPWNLKNLSSNNNNLLRSLNAVLGVTVPTLHLGMVFSTCCWHRDPHGLPWMEYMHEGPPKIWYGIPDEQSANFRHAVEQLCPTSCQQKDIWLSSDITMIPPNLLREHKVSLSRTVQNPGEFIIVFPKSYTCSISTGFTVSESVYFATNSWLKTVHHVFQELRSSYEPTTFSLEQLLLALAKDPRSSFGVLHTVHSSLTTIVDEEIRHRNNLKALGVIVRVRSQAKKRNGAAWNVREQDECQVCRTTLFLSKVTGVVSKKSDMCLLHALRVIDKRKPEKEEIAKMEMILFYSEKQLNEIVAHLQKRLFP